LPFSGISNANSRYYPAARAAYEPFRTARLRLSYFRLSPKEPPAQ
jgi:hypothetical protein